MRNQNVDAHVPFVTSNEQGIFYVRLENALGVVLEFLHVADDADAPAATQISWLANPNGLFVALLTLVGDDLAIIVWEYESHRYEVVYFSIELSQLLYDSGQIVFRAD